MSDDLRTRIIAAIRSEQTGTNEDIADAVIAELDLAKACESGCMWQIPNHVEDVTPTQRALLSRAYEDSLQSTAFAAIRLLEQHQTPRHFTEEAE